MGRKGSRWGSPGNQNTLPHDTLRPYNPPGRSFATSSSRHTIPTGPGMARSSDKFASDLGPASGEFNEAIYGWGMSRPQLRNQPFRGGARNHEGPDTNGSAELHSEEAVVREQTGVCKPGSLRRISDSTRPQILGKRSEESPSSIDRSPYCRDMPSDLQKSAVPRSFTNFGQSEASPGRLLGDAPARTARPIRMSKPLLSVDKNKGTPGSAGLPQLSTDLRAQRSQREHQHLGSPPGTRLHTEKPSPSTAISRGAVSSARVLKKCTRCNQEGHRFYECRNKPVSRSPAQPTQRIEKVEPIQHNANELKDMQLASKVSTLSLRDELTIKENTNLVALGMTKASSQNAPQHEIIAIPRRRSFAATLELGTSPQVLVPTSPPGRLSSSPGAIDTMLNLAQSPYRTPFPVDNAGSIIDWATLQKSPYIRRNYQKLDFTDADDSEHIKESYNLTVKPATEAYVTSIETELIECEEGVYEFGDAYEDARLIGKTSDEVEAFILERRGKEDVGKWVHEDRFREAMQAMGEKYDSSVIWARYG